MAQTETTTKQTVEVQEAPPAQLPANLDELTPSKWAAQLNIPEAIIQGIKTYSELGWALDANGRPAKLNLAQMKVLALIEHRTGLSALGKQLFFLGNGVYVAAPGKRAKARRDENMPLVRIELRPATKEEREAYPTIYDDPKNSAYEHVWYAEVYAKVDGQIQKVAADFGHACLANIHLKGKENDPRRLCRDMAATRAQSRALSQVYDFFGLDSYEEVALTPIPASYTVEETKTLADKVKERAEGCPAPTPATDVVVPPETPAPENVAGRPTDDTEPFPVESEPADKPAEPEPPLPSASGEQPTSGPAPDKPVTAEDVLAFVEEHKDVLPPADLKRCTEAKLRRYLPAVLAVMLKNLVEEVERAAAKEGRKKGAA